MNRTPGRSAAVVCMAVCVVSAGCSRGPSPSHAGDAYRGKLTDDVLVEASSTVLVTTKDVIIAMNCAPLMPAQSGNDTATIDRAVSAGSAARLPAGVTLYTPPFSTDNPRSAPLVVTDDRAAGRLCTPDAYKIVSS